MPQQTIITFMTRLLTSLICLMTATILFAQINVRGTVIDRETDEPVVGASVIVKGADGKIKKFASSKADGSFAVAVMPGFQNITTLRTRHLRGRQLLFSISLRK